MGFMIHSLVAAFLLLQAPRDPSGTAPVLKDVASPANTDSAFPHVEPDGKGGVYMTWLETLENKAGHRLRLARLARGAESFDAATTIHEGKLFWRNWADFPAVGVFPDGSLMVHWLERSGEGPYDYDIRARISNDAGATWGAPFLINTDGVRAEHGFVSFARTDKGLGVVWLDGRETKGAGHDAHASGSTAGSMTLRFAEFLSDGTRARETALDRRVCDCCQTALVATSKGLLAAYRDRSDDELRDISLARPLDPTSVPRDFSKDGWKIAACPVNGPALAASGSSVFAAWFTTAQGKARVRAAASTDGGETFSKSVDLDASFPIGRVDAVALPSGRALVTWIGRGQGGAVIRGSLIDRDGNAGSVFPLTKGSIERAAGFPRIEVAGDDVILAWTEITGKVADGAGPPPSRVRVGRFRAP